MLTRLLSSTGLGSSICKYKHGDVIISSDPNYSHSSDKEMDFIVSCDKIPSECGDECYVISSAWISRWMAYGKGKAALKSVGPIDNNHLIEESGDKLLIRPDIESKVDYRCVNKVMWEFLFRAYGGGPVIGFYIPLGLKQADLKSKTWMEHIVIAQIPTVVRPTSAKESPVLVLSPPFDMGFRDDVFAKKHEHEENQIIGSSVINAMQQGIGKNKLKEAAEMSEDVQLVAAKACLMALTKNAKKFEARTKMLSASKMLSRDDSDLDEEDRDVMVHMLREGAGLYLQLALKDLYLRRKSAALKEKQLHLKRDGAIMVLQSAWRNRQARIKREILIREKIEYLAARRLQGCARQRIARKQTGELRQTMRMANACRKIQRSFRCVKGRQKLSDMLNSFHPHNIVASMESATITSSTVVYKNPQDRFVVAAVFSLNSRARGLTQARQEVATGLKGAKKKRQSFTTSNPSNKGDNMTMLSFHRSGNAIENGAVSKCKWQGTPVNPEVNKCLMTNATPTSMLVFSVFEKQTFLGQAAVDFQDYSRRLYAGETVELKDLPLHTKDAILLHDKQQEKALINVPSQFGNYNTGLLTVRLSMPPLTRSMSGWVQRASSTFLHGGEFKRRWMILLNQKMLCFEDPYTLNDGKGEVFMNQITSVKYEKATGSIHIQFGAGGKNTWTIKWDQDEAHHLPSMWHRKFKRCLPAGIKLPDLPIKKRKSTL